MMRFLLGLREVRPCERWRWESCCLLELGRRTEEEKKKKNDEFGLLIPATAPLSLLLFSLSLQKPISQNIQTNPHIQTKVQKDPLLKREEKCAGTGSSWVPERLVDSNPTRSNSRFLNPDPVIITSTRPLIQGSSINESNSAFGRELEIQFHIRLMARNPVPHSEGLGSQFPWSSKHGDPIRMFGQVWGSNSRFVQSWESTFHARFLGFHIIHTIFLGFPSIF